MRRAVFVGEGPSDTPLADITRRLLMQKGVAVDVTTPDFDRLPKKIGRDVASKVRAAVRLTSTPIDLFIVHRDADASDASERHDEIRDAIDSAAPDHLHIPVVPVRMTEAWLLLDEASIRMVAGKPRGRTPLVLPSAAEVERRADPERLLKDALLAAAEVSGRRRERVAGRFDEHRRRLLEQLDIDGPVTHLQAWRDLLDSVEAVSLQLKG